MEQWNSLQIDNKIKKVIKELGLFEKEKYYSMSDFYRIRIVEQISRKEQISLQKYKGDNLKKVLDELLRRYSEYPEFTQYLKTEGVKFSRIMGLIFGKENIEKFKIKNEHQKKNMVYIVTKELAIFYNFMLEIATISNIREIRNLSQKENYKKINEDYVFEIIHRAYEIIHRIDPEGDVSFLKEIHNTVFRDAEKKMWEQYDYIKELLKKYELAARSFECSEESIKLESAFYKDIWKDLEYCANLIDIKGSLLFEEPTNAFVIVGSDDEIEYFSDYRSRLLR